MKKAPKKPINTDAWQATYGDMVTLLLCFFVMLYSMSSVDSAKWEMIVKSFNPNADKVSQIVTGEVTPGEDDVGSKGTDGIAELETIEQLYEELQKYVDKNNLNNDVKLFDGDGYVFLTFRNNIFFNEDSSFLREENKPILDFLAAGLKEVAEDVNEVRVFGHTNQADPNAPNAIDVDRNLSSMRASTVVSYLQKQGCIDPKKMSGIGYGQWYPVASYDTPEHRQQNRRVEILISKSGVVQPTLDEIYANISEETGTETIQDLQNNPTTEVPAPTPDKNTLLEPPAGTVPPVTAAPASDGAVVPATPPTVKAEGKPTTPAAAKTIESEVGPENTIE